jgi:hypothetical protein
MIAFAFLSGLGIGMFLALFAVFMLIVRFFVHREVYTPPTFHARRKHRDAPKSEPLREATDWDVAERPIYMYGVTGEER